MGQEQSTEHVARNVTTEHLSHELAQRFATKCFTPLELTHFKDVFRTLADNQDGIQFWKEETLCRFLVIPDALGPGPVIYQMATYLGAFPFPSLAPCILTREAMLNVVVVMTERYGKVLKNGRADKNKLFFRSLAVFDRRTSSVHGKPALNTLQLSKEPVEILAEEGHEIAHGHATRFGIDEPASDEEEDDDELSLAALESLDAIEVFKNNQNADTKVHRARIPIDNFRGLLMLLLVLAPLQSQEPLTRYAEGLTETRIQGLKRVADSILWSFLPEENAGISYHVFNTIVPASLPYLFDGLNPWFEHFLFSKNIDLSRQRRSTGSPSTLLPTAHTAPDTPFEPLLQHEGEILDLNVLSQLSFFMKGTNLFRRLRLLYSGGEAGFSIGSFEQKVLNWRAPSILLISGTRLPVVPRDSRQRTLADKLPPKRHPDGASGNSKSTKVVYGVYLNVPWKQTYKEAIGDSDSLLFQLEPIHEVFHASTINRDYATLTKSGIAFGNPPARAKPVSGLSSHVSLGPVSLFLDESLEYGVFTHDISGGGSFHPSKVRNQSWQDRFEIDSLEVWGCGGDEEAEKQRAAWAFEEREALARKNINLGKDIEADRALLAMAGLLASENHTSGGSMG
ncbi:Restriction of telomere capping protein 5 [Xylographa opegraphella]|nr:Restriction of telomere capping protein 5 [Xylographa opegraphella]